MPTQTLEELLSVLTPEEILGAGRLLGSPKSWAETLLKVPSTGKRFESKHVQDEILGSKHRYNVIRVSRRSGKSYSLAILALYYAFTRDAFEILIVCPAAAQVANLMKTIRDFIRVNDWLQPFIIENQKNPQSITFSNGSRILGQTTGAKQNNAAMGVRGQGADILLIDEAAYLNESDWPALTPIMQGDEHRWEEREGVRVYVASTPAHTRGAYYEFCKGKASEGWHEIHIPITANRSVTPEYIEECRSLCLTENDWAREYLAEFPEVGEGVFPKNLVEAAKRKYTYAENLARAEQEVRSGLTPPARTMGMDWDKFNSDGHGPTLVILEALQKGGYRVVYREEIPQHLFSFDKGVNRIIELNAVFRPLWIYLDHANGVYQLEALQKYGLANPSSELHKKCKGCWFNQSFDVPLPGGGKVSKRFKQAMISILQGWFERGQLEIPEGDSQLIRELIEYHVVGQTDTTIKFSNKNEHGIDACGLAAVAMFHKVKNTYAPELANRSYVVKAPEAVPERGTVRKYHDRPSFAGNIVLEGRSPRTNLDSAPTNQPFSRSNLGSRAPSRRGSF